MRRGTKSGPCCRHQVICLGPMQEAYELNWTGCWIQQGITSAFTNKWTGPAKSGAHNWRLFPHWPLLRCFVFINVMPLNLLSRLRDKCCC